MVKPAHSPSADALIQELKTDRFNKLSSLKKFIAVNETLLKFIQNAPDETFLLPLIAQFMTEVNAHHILDESYHIILFEFWLNNYSGINSEQNYKIRSKIVGKFVPRDEYQGYFPIGMNKTYQGSHFVVAHLSPDIDTTVASFWGWVDALAARVGTGQHMWSLPGGPPESPVCQIFRNKFGGSSAFSVLSRKANTLTLNAMDLLCDRNVVKKTYHTQISTLDHGFNEKAILLVDEEGHFCGDWRSNDVEPVRQIIILFKALMRWFETNAHLQLISFFSGQTVSKEQLPKMADAIFSTVLKDCETVKEFSDSQKEALDALLQKVLGSKEGLNGTFHSLNEALEAHQINELTTFRGMIEDLVKSPLFDREGHLTENRPLIFETLKKLMDQLNLAIHKIRDYMECLGVVVKIKSHILEKTLHYLTLRTDVDDMQIKMGNYAYLTVVVPDREDKLYPVGVVWASDLRKSILGTASFRDFCNPEEVKMAPYISVISVIDHHKSQLTTASPPMAMIGDAQSCNVLVAETTMALNQAYSTCGMDKESISRQLEEVTKASDSQRNLRLAQRLMQKKIAADQKGHYFIHSDREAAEYELFLHAILDDTDLLTKVSRRDVECVAALLNRLKTIAEKKETEIVDFDDIERDENFAKTAGKRLLRLPEMYALYSNVYAYKEKEVSEDLTAAATGHGTTLFQDTKEQNGCCRIGQTKLFPSNVTLYEEVRRPLQHLWIKLSEERYSNHPELSLFIHMISTIASAEDVYKEKPTHFTHKDEIWFWLPSTEIAQDRLASFLSAFQRAPEVAGQHMELHLGKAVEGVYSEIFRRNFMPVEKFIDEGELQIAVLKFKPGLINSRKSMISPYLPKVL
jgi:hypothetical protein